MHTCKHISKRGKIKKFYTISVKDTSEEMERHGIGYGLRCGMRSRYEMRVVSQAEADHGRLPGLWICCFFCSGCFPFSLLSSSFYLLATWQLYITILGYCINTPAVTCMFACVFSFSRAYTCSARAEHTPVLFTVSSIALGAVICAFQVLRKELSNELIN